MLLPPLTAPWISPPWKMFWVKTTSTGALPVPQHQKQIGINAYILFPWLGCPWNSTADSC